VTLFCLSPECSYLWSITGVSCIQMPQRYDAQAGRTRSGDLMRSRMQGQLANWEVRTWDVITVGVMVAISVIGALWMTRIS
jgi:hypothetical protein